MSDAAGRHGRMCARDSGRSLRSDRGLDQGLQRSLERAPRHPSTAPGAP